MEKVLLILDSPKEFPSDQLHLIFKDRKLVYIHDSLNNSDQVKEIIKSSLDELDFSEDSIPKTKFVEVFSFSSNKINSFITEYAGVKPAIVTHTWSKFKDTVEQLKSQHPDLYLPKVKISMDKDLDLLEVSKLFNISTDNYIKHVNGSNTPVLIPYDGLETFEYLNTLKSGVLTPASELEVSSLISNEDEMEVYDNKTIIFQMIPYEISDLYSKTFSYSTRSNTELNIVWTEVSNFSLSDEIFKKIESQLNVFNSPCYANLEVHSGKVYILKINQGIHPFYLKSN